MSRWLLLSTFFISLFWQYNVKALQVSLNVTSPTISWNPSNFAINGTGWNPRWSGSKSPYKREYIDQGQGSTWIVTNTSGAGCSVSWNGTGLTMFGSASYTDFNLSILVDGVSQSTAFKWRDQNTFVVDIQGLSNSAHQFSMTYNPKTPPAKSNWGDFNIWYFILTALPAIGGNSDYKASVEFLWVPPSVGGAGGGAATMTRSSTPDAVTVYQPSQAGNWTMNNDRLNFGTLSTYFISRTETTGSSSSMNVTLAKYTAFVDLEGVVGPDQGPFWIMLTSTDGTMSITSRYNSYNPMFNEDVDLYQAAIDPSKQWIMAILPKGGPQQYFRLQKLTSYAVNTPTTINVGAIAAGAVVGFLVIVAIIVGTIIYRRKRHRKFSIVQSRALTDKFEIEPYEESPALLNNEERQSTSYLSPWTDDSTPNSAFPTTSRQVHPLTPEEAALLAYDKLQPASSHTQPQSHIGDYPYQVRSGRTKRPALFPIDTSAKRLSIGDNENGDLSERSTEHRRRSNGQSSLYVQEEDGGRVFPTEEERVFIPPTYNPAWKDHDNVNGRR